MGRRPRHALRHAKSHVAGLTGRYPDTRSLANGLALLAAPLTGTFLYDLNPALLWAVCGAIAAAAAAIMTVKAPRSAAVRKPPTPPGNYPDSDAVRGGRDARPGRLSPGSEVG